MHDLTLAHRTMKMESIVMPTWITDIQVRRMRPETSMSDWIPAVHAGMTESKTRIKTDRGPPHLVFSKKLKKIVISEPRVFSLVAPSLGVLWASAGQFPVPSAC
jgi:hypothetical protein